ncbi:hypothetical protein Ae201684P_013637 [Aphanomyces euteiches]|uniref:glucan endo-1,3-beta-D-glucosidase n=1 Tax=Aphanomyces euteiches TaxID=100861 RepID=A0A6G0WD77_9STRA|nr:hypothetical protein Ae201684_016189 [Aphanomyces euteiches]KAH9052135.1 hypothetical protein Ae201684P_013637 [Aphanomyces euteiches]KAH9154150.1 hypothetical protein AeRB84_003714 [Aphanomyces euteiches]
MVRAWALVLLLSGIVEGLQFQLYGLNYNVRQGPDWDPNRCKTQSQVNADMQTIATVTSRVRIYSLADCNQGKMVLSAAKLAGLQVWLGIWVTNDAISLTNELDALDNMVTAKLIDSTVIGLHVGSENLYRKDITVDKAINYYASVKSYLSLKNFTFPVSITDVGDVLLQYPRVVQAVDIVMANQFPFWENASISMAIGKFESKYTSLVGAAQGKEVWIGETGWASSGTNGNASAATPENQATYVANFAAFAISRQLKYFYFAAFDEDWKIAQEGVADTVEAHFGIFDKTGQLKPKLVGLSLPPPTSSPPTTVPSSTTTNKTPSTTQRSQSSTPSPPTNEPGTSQASTLPHSVSCLILLCLTVLYFE